jgi:electron transport complex protein RnfA
MNKYSEILISTILVNNYVLVQCLGLCQFVGVSRKLETATSMGLATTFVLTISSICTYLIDHYLMIPLGLEYLRTIYFILLIAVIVQLTEILIKKTSPLIYQAFGIYLPLVTTNCMIIAASLLNVQARHDFISSALYGFGTAIGFSLVIILFAALRERILVADVPVYFRGSAIAMITIGLMSLTFMGFSGLIKG